MKNPKEKRDFFSKILVNWLGFLCFLVPFCFCFNTFDSAHIKITLFYMGSFGAFALWLASLIHKNESILTKKNLFTFLPLVLYALYLIGSYFLNPYKIARLDSFVREVLYAGLFLVGCFQLKEEDFKVILRYFFIAAWLIFIYGIVQVLNLDFLFWKNFFAKRVFSTLANPNFFGSYIVFTSVLIIISFLIKPSKNLLFLFILGLINLIFTESKGAWLAFALTMALIGVVFFFFFTDIYSKNKKKILALSFFIVIFAGISIFYFSTKRMQSVSFRLSTWRATFDMVKASPWTGTGIGSFEYIYPAYKRPEIFYMERGHNVETQHAENYYLEQVATLGFFGFGLFLWVWFYVLKQILFRLKILAKEDREKALLLAGFSLASASVYIHNMVDVSIYFVSTGLCLAISNGIIFNLAFGPFEKKDLVKKENKPFLFKTVLGLTFLILAAVFLYIQTDFWRNFIQPSKQIIMTAIYGVFFIVLSFSVLGLFVKIILKARRTEVSLLILLTGIFYLLCWFELIGNVYATRATALAEQKDFRALQYYTKALSFNPTLIRLYGFRGLMLFERFYLAEKVDLSAGDKKEASNDFKRAIKDFEYLKKLAPNIALLHYNEGSAYLKYAQTQKDFQREQMLLKAEENFKYALLLDPVYDNIYYQLANVEIVRGNKEKAIYWIRKYLQGPKEVSNPAYLKTHRENEKANQVLKQLGGSL